ncbi:DgyrCDS1334 [Dimorphilus gyrociliatus]|uniref:DgyrCDS1334 n=1 Tax=Dimorphilus gyrociliatus TaxID=2664684 RepID=A0A7I8V8G8_9ANNE|nr:DgyrCDS1334 [Dimorphilus gyrociliatus]
MSIDFHGPTAKQEQQSRRILEQLNEDKRRLKAATQNQSLVPESQPNPNPMLLPGDNGGASRSASQALKQAHESSFGYYVTQESNFGNVILPVLPRFVETKPAKS